jgi:hypothetical protein
VTQPSPSPSDRYGAPFCCGLAGWARGPGTSEALPLPAISVRDRRNCRAPVDARCGWTRTMAGRVATAARLEGATFRPVCGPAPLPLGSVDEARRFCTDGAAVGPFDGPLLRSVGTVTRVLFEEQPPAAIAISAMASASPTAAILCKRVFRHAAGGVDLLRHPPDAESPTRGFTLSVEHRPFASRHGT